MDFEGLFWIALIVFYFLSRVMGGKKGSKSKGGPTRPRPRPDRSRKPPSPGQPDHELDDALQEIRRALGFPVDEPKEEEELATSTVEPPARGVDRQAEQAARRAAEREEHRRAAERRASKLDERGRRDARELARQRELKERAQAASDRDRAGIPRPTVSTTRGPVTEHTFESSFAEEEKFEKIGAHPHVEKPARKAASQAEDVAGPTRSGIRHRLRSRESMQEAFVLKEVLDRPLATRSRRR